MSPDPRVEAAYAELRASEHDGRALVRAMLAAADRAAATSEAVERLAHSKDVRVYGDYATGWRDEVKATARVLATPLVPSPAASYEALRADAVNLAAERSPYGHPLPDSEIRAAWAGVDAALAAGRDEELRPGDLGAVCKRDDLGDWGA